MDDLDSEIEESESVFSYSNSVSSSDERNRLADQMRNMMMRVNELETKHEKQDRIIRDQNGIINALTAEVGALKRASLSSSNRTLTSTGEHSPVLRRSANFISREPRFEENYRRSSSPGFPSQSSLRPELQILKRNLN